MSGAHLSSMWEHVSKTAHIACKEQSRAGPSTPERTNCLQAWNKSSPTIVIQCIDANAGIISYFIIERWILEGKTLSLSLSLSQLFISFGVFKKVSTKLKNKTSQILKSNKYNTSYIYKENYRILIYIYNNRWSREKLKLQFQIRTLILCHVSTSMWQLVHNYLSNCSIKICNWSWILLHAAKCTWTHSH